MTNPSNSNIFIEQLTYSLSFLKSTLNFKMGMLKNIEMYYRSTFDKIVKNGIFVVFPVIGSDDVNIAALIDLGATNEGASRR